MKNHLFFQYLCEQTVRLVTSELLVPKTYKSGQLILKQERRSNCCTPQRIFFKSAADQLDEVNEIKEEFPVEMAIS